jgi:hypothetical protein
VRYYFRRVLVNAPFRPEGDITGEKGLVLKVSLYYKDLPNDFS